MNGKRSSASARPGAPDARMAAARTDSATVSLAKRLSPSSAPRTSGDRNSHANARDSTFRINVEDAHAFKTDGFTGDLTIVDSLGVRLVKFFPARRQACEMLRLSACDSPVSDVEDSDTFERADSGCSSATGGRGEAGHPAQDPRRAPSHHCHGAVRPAHPGLGAGGRR